MLRHRGTIALEHIIVDSNSYEKVGTFKYLGSLRNQYMNKYTLKVGNSLCYSDQTHVSSTFF